MAVLTEILTGAASEATEVCQVLIRQAALNTVLMYEGRRWYTRDLSPIMQRTRNQLNSLLFAIRKRYLHKRYRFKQLFPRTFVTNIFHHHHYNQS